MYNVLDPSMSDRGSRIQALMSPFFALKTITPLVHTMLKYFSELAQSLQHNDLTVILCTVNAETMAICLEETMLRRNTLKVLQDVL